MENKNLSGINWSICLIYDKYVEGSVDPATLRYEIIIPIEELQSKDLRLKYIKSNNKNTSITIDFLKVTNKEMFTMNFSNKNISNLISQIFDLIDKYSGAYLLKIIKDDRKYVIYSLSNGVYSYDIKYYNLHEDLETYDKITIETTTKIDEEVDEEVVVVNKIKNTLQSFDKYNKWNGFIDNICGNIRKIQSSFIQRIDVKGWKNVYKLNEVK